MALKSAIGKVLSDSDFQIMFSPEKSLKEQDIDIAGFAKLAALVDSNTEVFEALMKCLAKCSYESEKITKATFESAEARGDYYPIAFACLKENLLPFFKSLLSQSSPAIQAFIKLAMTKAQESIQT